MNSDLPSHTIPCPMRLPDVPLRLNVPDDLDGGLEAAKRRLETLRAALADRESQYRQSTEAYVSGEADDALDDAAHHFAAAAVLRDLVARQERIVAAFGVLRHSLA